jgi:acetate kinase
VERRPRPSRVLVVNAGSSSLKLTLLGPGDETLADASLDAPQARVDEPELLEALSRQEFAAPDAVGHRIVHGGTRFQEAAVIDAEVVDALRDLTDLAPLHQPKSLAALDAVSAVLPGVPAVACFDTAFHAGLPAAAATYALPAAWRERWGLRRFGFHGLSHAWVARRARELAGAGDAAGDDAGGGAGLRTVSCHLGAGASLCAILDGRSVDTTMGFTPLEGLVMATRSGTVDPGLLMWLLEHTGLSEHELNSTLEHESGLLGLAGTADMHEVLERADRGDEPASLALRVYIHRLRAGCAAMVASLGGIDVLAFTGGVGEHAPRVRELACEGLGFLGVEIASALNSSPALDAEITAAGAAVRTLVIRAREDLEIARQTRAALEPSAR